MNNKLQFFTYKQNNSYGRIEINDNIKHIVIIEAYSASEANEIAERIGIYFDEGYAVDCTCCGTRWSRASLGTDNPKIYDVSPEEYLKKYGWASKIIIHHYDGVIENYIKNEIF